MALLDVSNNSLFGTLPEAIGQWDRLTEFDVKDNSLNGALPRSIANWTLLEQAAFNTNNSTGLIPESLFHFANIRIDCPMTLECDCCQCA
jgi:Leucine-rich repeat (LRR) protein